MMILSRYSAAWQRRSWAQRRLLLAVWFWLGWARLQVLILPFRWLVVLWGLHSQPLSQHDRMPMSPTALPIQAISAAIAVSSPHTPWHSNCLAQALAASALLRRRGLVSRLYLGVANDRTQGLQAHAWLVSDEQFVTGAAGRQHFVTIAVFDCQARHHRAATA